MPERPAERRRSTKHDGVGHGYLAEMNKIEAEHNSRVELAVKALCDAHSIGREGALKRIAEHILESGAQAQHLHEELVPSNWKNADIARYFTAEKWRALLGRE